MRDSFSLPVRLLFGWTQKRPSVEHGQHRFFHFLSWTDLVDSFKGLIYVEMWSIPPELISTKERSLSHKPKNPEKSGHIPADPWIHIIPVDTFGILLDNIPDITNTFLNLFWTQNIAEDNKPILLIKLLNFLQIKGVDIKGECEPLFIIRYFMWTIDTWSILVALLSLCTLISHNT